MPFDTAHGGDPTASRGRAFLSTQTSSPSQDLSFPPAAGRGPAQCGLGPRTWLWPRARGLGVLGRLGRGSDALVLPRAAGSAPGRRTAPGRREPRAAGAPGPDKGGRAGRSGSGRGGGPTREA